MYKDILHKIHIFYLHIFADFLSHIVFTIYSTVRTKCSIRLYQFKNVVNDIVLLLYHEGNLMNTLKKCYEKLKIHIPVVKIYSVLYLIICLSIEI